MRVLHVFKTYFPDSFGGIERVIHQLCTDMQRCNVQCEVLTLSREPGERKLREGHKVHRCKLDLELASTGFSLEALRALPRLSATVDIVHYHFPWPFMDMAHFYGRIARPTVLTYHSDIVRQRALQHVYAPLRRRFLKSVDQIVATSPNYLATSPVLKEFRDKVRVVPIGLDKPQIPGSDDRAVERWRLRLPPRFFLFVGVLRYYKGLHILLDALRRAEYPVVIVGAGPTEQSLRRHAAKLGLKHTHFLGVLSEDDKHILLRMCHAVVFPSHLRSEAFGITLLEGAMHAKPLISSELGTGTSYINVHGETGLVVPPGDPEALHVAMRSLWEQPEWAAQMGQRAEQRYHRLFTAGQMSRGYLDIYTELMADRGGVRRPIGLPEPASARAFLR